MHGLGAIVPGADIEKKRREKESNTFSDGAMETAPMEMSLLA